MALIEYSTNGAIASIRLNRPKKLNAINGEMLDGLGVALDQAESDDAVRVVLLSGEGRAFSAGFDLDIGAPPAGVSLAEHTRGEIRRDFDLIMRFWDCPKPVIAAVHGYCLGSAMEITAVCDITLAADDCLFGAPEVRFGSGIVCLILPWVIGLKQAKELLLTGDDKVSAERAVSIGLVNKAVPVERLMAEAVAMAERIAANDELAVGLTKRAINRSAEMAGLRDALDEALQLDLEIETATAGRTK
jgi:enoyl-CoA hydratase